MTAIYNPFRDMERLFNQVSRPSSTTTASMPLDLYRDGDNFIVKMDLPGVDTDSIDIDIDDRTLTIRAERKPHETTSTHDNDTEWVTRERTSGSYARQLTLSKGLALDQITAEYQDGVLTLTIPVAEESKPRKIQVIKA